MDVIHAGDSQTIDFTARPVRYYDNIVYHDIFTNIVIRYFCFLNSEETTQLRRMATWEKGPTTEPRTRDLRPNAEFQPREPRSRSRSFVPHRHLCASHGYAANLGGWCRCNRLFYLFYLSSSTQVCGPITIQHTSASLEVAGLKRSWIRHTRDWHISGNVGRRSVTGSVARVAETPR